MAIGGVGESDMKIEVLRKAVSAQLDFDVAEHELGRTLCEAGAQEAIALLRHAVALRPENVAYRQELAKALSESGDLAGAEGEFRQAVRLDPRDADVRNALGVVLLRAEIAMGRSASLRGAGQRREARGGDGQFGAGAGGEVRRREFKSRSQESSRRAVDQENRCRSGED